MLIGLGVVLAFVLAAGSVGAAYVVNIVDGVAPLSQLPVIRNGTSSIVYAKDGTRLGVIQSDILRTPVPSAQIPTVLKQATVAIEDQRFYHHKGVDFTGILRAAAKDVSTGRTLQGGSTITMQLARNLYINNEHTLKRKIREAVIAMRLEKAHDKDWILTSYLNSVPYGTVGGQGAIGVQAAARIFYDKPASALTLPQAALIAGLPQAPSTYNPFRSAAAARTRRNEVLTKMAQLNYITPAQQQSAIAAPLGVRHGQFYTAHRESFFFDYVKKQLISRFGAAAVEQGGLKIYTTIDLHLQQLARNAIAGVLNQPSDPSSAVVSIDPRTGYIRAMAESAKYDSSQFNLASQGHRQPGSTFKAMVLLTALRRGVDPDNTFYDSKPLDFTDPIWGPIKVQTYSNSYRGSENIVQATLQSDNTIYQQLDLDVGPKNVAQTAHDAGVVSPLQGLPAEGLGGLRVGVTPLEMADAYSTLADGGLRDKPIAVTRIEFPDGRVDDLSRPTRTRAFSDGVTAEETKILQQNIQSGTGVAANFGCPAAGKTGTTDNFTDAWFDGYTPHMTTVVWVGYPKGKVPMTSVHGISVAGGTFPAQIWHDYMQGAHGSDCADFTPPTHPISYQPFSGQYASNSPPGPSGNTSGSSQNSSPSNGIPSAKKQHAAGGTHGGGAGQPPGASPHAPGAPPANPTTPPAGTPTPSAPAQPAPAQPPVVVPNTAGGAAPPGSGQ
ncbi:MAG: transglycosylase domain-containing protein [Solirubrobacteraceae bacterium]